MKVMCEVIETHEVYEGYQEKVIQTIVKDKKVSREQADSLLMDSTELNVVECYRERFWIEDGPMKHKKNAFMIVNPEGLPVGMDRGYGAQIEIYFDKPHAEKSCADYPQGYRVVEVTYTWSV